MRQNKGDSQNGCPLDFPFSPTHTHTHTQTHMEDMQKKGDKKLQLLHAALDHREAGVQMLVHRSANGHDDDLTDSPNQPSLKIGDLQTGGFPFGCLLEQHIKSVKTGHTQSLNMSKRFTWTRWLPFEGPPPQPPPMRSPPSPR